MDSHWSSKRTVAPPKLAPSFDLGGEKFLCVEMVNAGAIDDLLSGIQLSDDGDRMYKAPSLVRFLRACIREEEEISVDEADARGISDVQREPGSDGKVFVPADDTARFQRLIRDKRRPVAVEDLGELAMWLASYYSGDDDTRPTGRSGV